jgi:prolyl oligopeptidase
LEALQEESSFKALQSEAEAALTDPSQVPEVMPVGPDVYNYWQDRKNPLGIWRRTTADLYFAGKPAWKTVIDLDQLSQAEGRKWIFAGASCREQRCLVRLSENGKDASELREFDLTAGRFLPGGFNLPEGKTRSWWHDADTLLVAPIYGSQSVNESGLPRTLRLWRRGTPINEARTVFEIGNGDAMLSMMPTGDASGRFIGVRHIDFNSRTYTLVDPASGTQRALPLPALADMHGMHRNKLLFRLNAPWTPTPGVALPAGALVAIAVAPLLDEGRIDKLEVLYRPAAGEAVRGVQPMDGRLFVELYRNYRSAIVELTSSGSGWTARTVPLEKDRFLSLLDTHDGKLFVKVEAPLVPEKLVLADAQTGAATVLYQRKAAFDTRNLVAELRQTQSRDGTPISYTLIRRKDLKRDGTNPTLVYGYGGYDVAVTPRYEPIFGKLWLQKGGTYVHAYLRGGGENGPDWHRGPMRKNRQQPYDDMAAVLEDLQRSRVSSPRHIGIMGRSNGGLMTAVMMEQRPELMNAVVVGGPLIDMLNFHELAPGASWTAEYGDPRDPDMRAFLATYSPMQNIRTGVRYPKPLIITSLDDDRVLPGHARRFAARLTEAGHDNYYFEDQQGGHYWELAGGPAPGDWRLRSVARAVEFAYLWQQLRSSPNKGK